jgi:HSP20 family protein
MTMHDVTSFSRQQTPMPAFWRDYEAFPFATFRREMGRWFDDLFRAPAYDRYGGYGYTGTFTNWPVIQVKEFDSEVVFTAEVPGLTEKDIELFFDKDMLIIRGVKKGEKDEFGYSEFFYGRFERQIPLPYSIDVEKCLAEFRDGLLTVHLPKLAEVENKKKIPISVETRH